MKRDNRPIHLLLIEDNPGDALLIEEYLTEMFGKARITQLTTSREAGEALQSGHDFDAILLDLSLPDAEGMNLVDRMLDLAGTVPVIILTGYTDLEFSVESLSKGVSDYLLKDDLSPTLLYKSIAYGIERNTFSAQLKESEKNYRELFEMSPLPMLLYDIDDLTILNVNKACIEQYGYDKEEFLTLTFKDLFPESDYSSFNRKTKKIREKGGKNSGIYKHIKKNGDVIQVHVESNGVFYRGKNARILLADDVTEKLKEEERLKLLESVITNTTETVVILEAQPTDNANRKILFVNNAFTEATGYRRDEVIGKPLNFLYGLKTNVDKIKSVLKSMENWEICNNVELINYRKDGTPIWVNVSFVPVADEKGNYTHWVAIASDISERVEYEEQLKESIAEKKVLLSEIHHRVKNNLAVVSGLMQLQAFEENDERVEMKLTDSILRIRTMASIHELLYESESLSQVDFTRMIRKLSTEISNVLKGDKQIDLDIIEEPIQLNINQAIPCALIINEILTNAYKHAFIHKDTGRIEILIQSEGENVLVTVKDNGVGLDKDSADHESSLGMRLIKILTDQLEGDYNYYGDKTGTTFTIDFVKRDVKGAASAYIK